MTKECAADVAGAILPDGRVNIEFLQREIASDLSNDARYSAEDGMKKRAVHLSKDYDEFKNFVAVSQLAPVSSSEMGQLFVQRQQPGTSSTSNESKRFGLNKICNDSSNLYNFDLNRKVEKLSLEKHKTKAKDKSSKKKKERVPRNASEFQREWRQCWVTGSPTNALKYLLLPKGAKFADILDRHVAEEGAKHSTLLVPKELRLSPEDVAKLHMIEMSSSTMEQIIEALHFYLEPFVTSGENAVLDSLFAMASTFVYGWMTSLTKCGRFSLNIQFFESKHKELAYSILELLEKEARRACEDLRLEAILNLMKSYK